MCANADPVTWNWKLIETLALSLRLRPPSGVRMRQDLGFSIANAERWREWRDRNEGILVLSANRCGCVGVCVGGWVQAVLDYTTALHNPCNERFYYHTNRHSNILRRRYDNFQAFVEVARRHVLLCTAGLTYCQFELVRDFSYH